MNWGKGILITFVIFAAAIISFVTLSMRQNIDLVTKDYYAEELKYQDKINKMAGSEKLRQKLIIEREGSNLNIVYPVSISRDIKGKVSFYRPSDAGKDFSVPVSFNENGLQAIGLTHIDKGLWRVEVDWQLSSEGLYNEEYLFIE